MSVKSIFIVWGDHSRRAETLAAELDVQVRFLYELRLKGGWLTPLRYLVQGWKTWHVLEREQPEVVLVQSPPIFAALVVKLWCELRGKTRPARSRVSYAIDCHPSTFFSRKWRWALPLLRFLSRRAVVTLSSNAEGQNILQGWKVSGFFLADGVPSLSPPVGTIGSEGDARVAVISTFADVEPIAEVFAAAQLLPRVTFYVTGDPRRASARLLAQKPENVTLTGFLRGGTYTALLKNVHGIVILTNQPKDLSCAAYEAVAMAKPAVVSDCSENKRWFTHGFVYVNNTPEAIAEGVKKMLNEQAILVPEVIAMRSELAASRQPKFEELAALLK
jgi:glycosyltransferase involved in cell wall biosynthesis